MRPRTRRKVAKLVRALSLLLILGALGAGVWVARQRAQDRTLSDTITRPAPEYGPVAQVLLPGLRGARVVVPDRPHTPDEIAAGSVRRTRSFLVDTNALGLRGPELPAALGPRVLAVGDSVTFGWGVCEAQSWPARLSDALGMPVLNAGVPAQRPPAIAAWTAANAEKLGATLILMARRPDPREADPVARYVDAVLQIQAAAPGIPLGVILPPLSTFDPDGLARAEDERAALVRALAPVPVLDLTPAFRAAAPNTGVILETGQGRQRVLRLPERTVLLDVAAPERGLAPDVLAGFEADATWAEPLFFDGGHPDAAGFQVFAEVVAVWLRGAGLLGPPATSGDAPLIPAMAPEWQADPPAFVDDPAFYGEASWDDVRGRVVQHQATVWRDRARLRAMGGDLAGCAALYAEGVGWLQAHPIASGVGSELHARYLAAMRRDAALCLALSRREAPPLPEAGLARLRALKLGGAPPEALQEAARALSLPEIDPRRFTDFEGRHRLRLLMVEAQLDALDPLRLPDVWGPWSPDARAAARDALSGASAGPSLRSARGFSAEGLGALPTGDSWVDTAGEPGPAAIGRLEKLSLEDPEHRAWLDVQAHQLQAVLDRDPSGLRAALLDMLAVLDGYPYTSRYYNIKQARNEAVRQLARLGRYREAAALLDDSFPLHRQDFACPNRAGILRGIQGRLLGLAGDPGAEARMREALALGDAFLSSIDQARPR